MEASLTCAVCLGVFREPVTLPRCSHNFCKSCVLDCAAPHTVTQPGLDDVSPASTVSCPLCRKVSCIPGGLASLSVNTTLAEIVRHLAITGESRKLPACPGDLELSPPGQGTNHCPDHPELKLQLFCKNCAEPCCGKCVSSKHQGIFHNVNLLDMIYQEEKLMFFSSLKKLREVNEKLSKKVPDEELEKTLQKNTEMVTSAFDEIQKALDLKKQQLLDSIKEQQSTAMKRNEVRKVTQAHYLKTVGSLLQDCENVVNESEPQSFLQVACDLNKRMKSSLDLMELSTDKKEDSLKPGLHCVKHQPVLDAISALKMTSSNSNDFLTGVNETFSFNTIIRTWKNDILSNENYCPVQNQELYSIQGLVHKRPVCFVSITQMPGYQHVCYEELRLKYYEESSIQESKTQRSVLPNNRWNFNLEISGLRDAFKSACSFSKTGLQDDYSAGACFFKSPHKVPEKGPSHFLNGGTSNLSRRHDTKMVKEAKPSKVKACVRKATVIIKPFPISRSTIFFSDAEMPMASSHVQQSQKQANEVPEDGSSEEFYDANSNENSEGEETGGQMNIENSKDSQPSPASP